MAPGWRTNIEVLFVQYPSHPLSLILSPFSSCLSSPCSTRRYFLSSLLPLSIYRGTVLRLMLSYFYLLFCVHVYTCGTYAVWYVRVYVLWYVRVYVLWYVQGV